MPAVEWRGRRGTSPLFRRWTQLAVAAGRAEARAQAGGCWAHRSEDKTSPPKKNRVSPNPNPTQTQTKPKPNPNRTHPTPAHPRKPEDRNETNPGSEEEEKANVPCRRARAPQADAVCTFLFPKRESRRERRDVPLCSQKRNLRANGESFREEEGIREQDGPHRLERGDRHPVCRTAIWPLPSLAG